MSLGRQLDFDEVSDLLVAVDAHNSPAEMHGFLVGQLAAGKRMTQQQWLYDVQEVIDTDNEFTEAQKEQLYFIYIATLATLSDDTLSFQPLLPEDDDQLEERLTCLGDWCQGFLAGFALVEKAIVELSEPVNDALNDLAAIAQVGANEEDEWNESADEDYMQLIEYIRLAVMSVFLEYAANDKSIKKAEEASVGLTAQSLFSARKLH